MEQDDTRGPSRMVALWFIDYWKLRSPGTIDEIERFLDVKGYIYAKTLSRSAFVKLHTRAQPDLVCHHELDRVELRRACVAKHPMTKCDKFETRNQLIALLVEADDNPLVPRPPARFTRSHLQSPFPESRLWWRATYSTAYHKSLETSPTGSIAALPRRLRLHHRAAP